MTFAFLSCSLPSDEPCAVTMSRANPAEPSIRGSSRVVVPFTGPPLKTSDCEHTPMRASPEALVLRETFQIARGGDGRGDGRRRLLRARRRRRVRRGRARRLLGRDARADRRGPRGRRRSAARRRPLRRRGDPRPRGRLGRPAGREDGARRRGPRLAGQARRPAAAPPARHGPDHAADLVHDRHRHRRGHRGPHPPGDGLRGAQDQGRRPRRRRAAAGRAGGDVRAAADRRQRRLGPRHRPRAHARADRARRRVRRAAVPGAGPRRLPRLPGARAAAAGADRRGLPRPARRSRRSPPTRTGS